MSPKRSTPTPSERQLTDVELELMNILWKLGEGGVSDILEKLPKTRELAYTSVSTVLRILEQKGVVKTRKEGRGHVYIPVLSRAANESRSVQHVVDRVFEGAPVALVRQLLGSSTIGSRELQEIQQLLEQHAKRKG